MSARWDEWQQREWERRDLTRARFGYERIERSRTRQQVADRRRSLRRQRAGNWTLGIIACAPMVIWYVRAW